MLFLRFFRAVRGTGDVAAQVANVSIGVSAFSEEFMRLRRLLLKLHIRALRLKY